MKLNEFIGHETISEAKSSEAKYVFVNPKNKSDPYSGEYVALVQKETKPMQYNFLKKIKPGVYNRKELIKLSGIPNSSYLVDQLPFEYQVPEISFGQVVKINRKGELEYTSHNHKKVVISKAFTDFLIKKKFLIPDEE